MSKKIHFVFAPVFLFWPVEILKSINILRQEKVVGGGFIGGPRKYHEILKQELGDLGDKVIYTHDLEKEWISQDFREKDLEFFIDLLGNDTINRIIISDRHIGSGFLAGGGVADSEFGRVMKSNKKAHLNYVVGMLNYLYDYFKTNKPDLLYSYAVAGSFTYAISELCKVLDIPFVKLTHTRIEDRIILDTSATDEMEIVGARFNDENRKFSEKSLNFGRQYLNKFREKQDQPDYQILQNNIYLAKTRLKYSLKLRAKYIKGSLNRSNEFFHTSYLGNVKYERNVVKQIKKFWKTKPFYNSSDLIDKEFLYYPMHVDPEASTMVISPYQTNQFAVLEAIAKSKPINQIILVKEHLTMIGRRPEGFYEKINSLPGVYLVDPTESSFKFIKEAKAVLTLTGTAGLEAIFLKKPAIFLGNFIYKFINEGFVLTNDLSNLPGILGNLQEIKSADDETLIRLLASIDEVSFSFNGGLIWSGVSKKVVEENPEAVQQFAKRLNTFI